MQKGNGYLSMRIFVKASREDPSEVPGEKPARVLCSRTCDRCQPDLQGCVSPSFKVTFMPDRPCNSIAVWRPTTTGCALFCSFTFCLSCSVLWYLAPPVSAEMRVISSQGEFRMGDRDTREDAMRL